MPLAVHTLALYSLKNRDCFYIGKPKKNTGAILERYLALPGGVTKTYRGDSRVFSLPNLHGDVMATTDKGGNQTGTYQYDPFGNKISSALPNNTSGPKIKQP